MVTVIGTVYIGLVSAACLAELDNCAVELGTDANRISVLAGAGNIGRHMTDFELLVGKGSAPVGTADHVTSVVAAELAVRGADVELGLASNADFSRSLPTPC